MIFGRHFLIGLIGLLSSLLIINPVFATNDDNELRFPGDPTDHNVVFQFNKADQDYHNSILFHQSQK